MLNVRVKMFNKGGMDLTTEIFEGYKYIGTKKGVCGNRPIILGTRLEPDFIVNYGMVEDVLEDFEYLTQDQVEECYWFVYKKK